MSVKVPEDFYQSLFENSFDGLAYCQMIFDSARNPVDFVYLKVNKNFEKLTGLRDVVGKKVTQIMPGIRASNDELFEIYGRVAMTGQPHRFETYIEPIGRWFVISVYSPKKNFFVAVFQNITDRKQIEESLENQRIAARNVLEDLGIEKTKVEAARAKDEAMLASIGDGVIIVDPAGRITFMNESAQKFFGWEPGEVTGKLLFDMVPVENEKGEAVPATTRPMAIALATGRTTSNITPEETPVDASSAVPMNPGMYYYIRKDKTRCPVAITVAPVKLENKVIGAIEVFRDITKEKEIDKAKTEFVSLASHQLRTPLSAVSWYTEMLLSGDAGPLNAEQKKYLEEVYRGNRRMVELVNALLNVSRLELGTFLIEPEPTNVADIARNVIKEQTPEIDLKHIRLTPMFDSNLPMIQADPKLLRIVLQNLLSNAIKYTPPAGRINLSVQVLKHHEILGSFRAPYDSLAIVVSDTGYGIPKSQQDKMFTKLFRADNVREKDTEGTGLGLYIVKSILDNSGGTVWFVSPTLTETAGTEENQGTTFYVTLPLTGMKRKEGTKGLE